ncbi:MAG: AMP-binding protein [Chlorobi bacterium]|nr:AMP-binding protein [Chlorobiota bacterium]
MNDHKTSLSLNSITYQENELANLCLSKLASFPLQAWEYSLYDFILQWISDEGFVKVKTSGSTGKPKEIKLDKKAMVESAKLTGGFLKLQKGNKALLCLPMDFIAGKMMVVRAFVLGLDLFPVEPLGNPLENINECFDFAAMTPMQVFNILNKNIGTDKLNKIKNLIIGGGEISPELESKLASLENKTYHTYGMTETITHIALRKINGKDENKGFVAMENVLFEQDERDCLIIHIPHISNEKIITNDIIKLKNKTEFEFIGRYDNVINSGGIKIIPENIEKKLEAFINQRFFVYGIPDEKLGEKLVLVIEGKPDNKIEKALEKVPFLKFEKPKKIIFIDKFIETGNGKINRGKIFSLYQNHISTSSM